MKLKSIAAALVLTLAGGIVSAFSVPAQAVGGITVEQNVSNRQDDNDWARDDFKRTAKIVGSGTTYTVTLTDEGTFTTKKGEPSPNAGAAVLSRSLKGSFEGGGVFHVTGHLKSSSAIEALPDSFDDTDGVNITTGNWWKQFFKSSATSPGIVGWKWAYATADETMVQEDGKPIVGDITGKLTSKLTAANKCRVSKKDKRNVWTVSNVQGDRSRTFSYWVKYNNLYSAHFSAAVAPGQTVQVITPGGGRLTVSYYDGYTVNKRVYVYSKASIVCA